ncbi:hypothetical protein [Nakamurella sp.]|uniref:Rv1733c family protein n=1 Tax=Nakamurella sp. TaxID=1869182 RepID=UPI003B3B56F3
MNTGQGRPAHRAPLFLRIWGSPLARGSDRAEAVLVAGLVVVWLLTIPFIATIASAEWPGVQARVVGVQQAQTAVGATLVTDADLATVDAHSYSVVQPMASATWTGRDGRPAGGSIVVRIGARAGDQQTIWLDEQGRVADPPMSTRTAAGLLVLVAAGAWLMLGILFLAIRRTAGWSLDRRRHRSWEDEWARFDAGSRSS